MVRKGTRARREWQMAIGTARAMAGWATVAAAYLGGFRCPWSGTCREVTAGSSAARRRAAVGGGEGSAFGRAVAAAGPAAGTGCRPWWAARPLRGVAQAGTVYERVMRRQ